jgi:GNAT superfamily N-acetyltransferase
MANRCSGKGEGQMGAQGLLPQTMRDSSIIVRPRTDTDLPACIAAVQAVHSADRYPSTLPDDVAAWLTPPEFVCAWVAVPDSTIVGHVSLGSVADEADVLEIQRLFVVPSARRCGIGKMLLDTASMYAKLQGFRPMIEVTSDREAAIRLYEANGWQRVFTGPANWVRASGERPFVHRYELVP